MPEKPVTIDIVIKISSHKATTKASQKTIHSRKIAWKSNKTTEKNVTLNSFGITDKGPWFMGRDVASNFINKSLAEDRNIKIGKSFCHEVFIKLARFAVARD